MHRLSSSFVLGYHGCDQATADRLLSGEAFKASQNDYDWLGWGVYFWEANPQRGLDFAIESSRRPASKIERPAVVGAVLDLRNCLDLMTLVSIEMVRTAFTSLRRVLHEAGQDLPMNTDRFRRQLDCAVIEHLHAIYETRGGRIDTVRGVFTEGKPIYPGSAFDAKTHIQIAVRSPDCVKGVFRVPDAHLTRWTPPISSSDL